MIKVFRYEIGAMPTNAYIGYDEETKAGFLIDPAVYVKEITEKIWQQQEQLNLKTVFLMNEYAEWLRFIRRPTEAFQLFAHTYETCKDKLETAPKIEILYSIQTCSLNVGLSELTPKRREYRKELEKLLSLTGMEVHSQKLKI